MTLTILLGLAFATALLLFVKQIKASNYKESIAQALLSSGKLIFNIHQQGKYTIWNKRTTSLSLLKRGINNYTYSLVNKKNGESIPLERERDHSKASYNHSGKGEPFFEDRWRAIYSFTVPPGQYELNFDKTDVGMQIANRLGIFNPFREINAEKYTIEIVPYKDLSTKIKDALLTVLLFGCTSASFIFFVNAIQSFNNH